MIVNVLNNNGGGETPKGYIEDYISGINVKATPEEIDAVQVFSRILVEDYGYPKEYIQTRPQHRVKKCPSDKQGYPMDIVVFEDKEHSKIKIIIECKSKSQKIDDHIEQLKIYMALSDAKIGVIYNGVDSVYLCKLVGENGGYNYEKIPSIPKFGERLDEIGLLKKSQLIQTHNLKPIFNEIQGWVVANGNITRPETIASQIILLILCKIFDEKFTPANDICRFRTSIADTDGDIKQRIDDLFVSASEMYDDVIMSNDLIDFDGRTLRGIIGRLQSFSIIATDRDCIADAFEVFIDKSVKESEGQFFTPRNVIKVMIEAIQLKRNKKVIDTACGSGGFLVEVLKKYEDIVNEDGCRNGWNDAAKKEDIKAYAIKCIRGIEKDPFLTKLSKAYMAILGDGKGGIFQEDSLEIPSKWDDKTKTEIKLDSFDFLLANPPFGKNIKVEGEDKLKQYTLSYSYTNKGARKLKKTGNVSTLFLERNMQMLKSGGVMGIILPEPYFALPSYKDAIDFMFNGNNVMWIIDLPQNTFRPHNNAKCCAIIIQKDRAQQEFINMAVAEYIGHDHQGKPIYDGLHNIKDDTVQIIKEISERNRNQGNLINHYDKELTFRVNANVIKQSKILVPRFYWETSMSKIEESARKDNIRLLSVRQLIDEGIITSFSGHGSPKSELKGEGDIPYIRVKDIVNWQPYTDITALIPREEYDRIFSEKRRLKPKDILYVSRGSYRIGSVAMVSPYDGEMLLTKEINVIRLINENNVYGITPEYLMYAFSHLYVWEQTKNKVFYEPCLPNIADRWKDIYIPIFNDKEMFEQIKDSVKAIVENQWGSKELMQKLRETASAYLI